jgi:hypothetical protein
MGKYPSMGMDCRRSINGVKTNEATLFVAASMPNETPQITEITSVMTIREIVLNVYKGKFAASGFSDMVMIDQPITQRTASPPTKLAKYFFKLTPHFLNRCKRQKCCRLI